MDSKIYIQVSFKRSTLVICTFLINQNIYLVLLKSQN